MAGGSGETDFDRLGDLLQRVAGKSATDLPDCAAPADRSGREANVPQAASRRDPAYAVASIWPEVVGPEVVANAQPVQLRQGRLVVSASSSVWAQTLHLMSDAIVARLNDRLGPGSVKRVIFRHAGWEESLQRRCPDRKRPGMLSKSAATGSIGSAGEQIRPGVLPDASRASLSQPEEDALVTVEYLDLTPELRGKIIRTMRAAFVRMQQDVVR